MMADKTAQGVAPAVPEHIIKALEHVPQLVLSRHAHASVHGEGAVGKLNTKLAVFITTHVGTMWAAYVFTVIGVTALVGR